MAQRRKPPSNVVKDVPNIGESDGSEDELKNVMEGKKNDQGRNLKEWSPYSSNQQEQQQPLSLRKSDSRRSPCVSPSSGDGCTSLSTPMEITGSLEETSSNGNKDEEDDENEDDPEDERIDAQYDPERLKAFNMFVRLFVDENLDRIVPISKQPKEKIQAIIDACARQFPEFADRTRKRIRTYLKSCRRNKRARDSNGWENSRPTPPHLTSIQAEQILATACENEAQNAKRMRLGLEPVSQNNHFTSQSTPVSQTTANNEHRPLIIDSSPGKIDSVVSSSSANVLGKTLERSTLDPKTNNIHAGIFSNSYQSGFSKSPLTCNTIGSQNSSSMFLPGGSTASVTSPTSSSALGAAVSLSSTGSIQMVANGPTDLSLKGTSSKSSVTRPSLNPIEVAAVRQLITGYRESAAFLLRSADELESLLTHQQSTSS